MYSGWSESFPFGFARSAVKTALNVATPAGGRHTYYSWAWHPVPTPPDSVAAGRVRFPGAGGGGRGSERLGGAVVAMGGFGAYREHCPRADACLAVEFSPSGEVSRAWPLSRAALAAAPGPSLGHEVALGWDSAEQLRVFAVAPYEDGDLSAVFQYRGGHSPSYLGVARIDGATGQALWFRRDYSHHEPLVAAGDTVWVAGAALADGPLRAPPFARLACHDVVVLDLVRAVDEAGKLVEEVHVLDVLANSPWAPVLALAPDPCDPFHLNSIAFVRDDVAGLPGVEPGDLVLSFRNLSAFAVVGRENWQVKRYVRGTFHRQHSVLHLGGSKFIMFDNRQPVAGRERRAAADSMAGASRVLVVDVASGEEQVVFPGEAAPQRFKAWRSGIHGKISVSPDGTRVLASYSVMGRAVEIRLEDGVVLAEFDDVHDVRGTLRWRAGADVMRKWPSRYLYRNERRR